VVQDEDGNEILGFSCCVGITSSYNIAQLWAMRDGFTLCLNRNFPAVIIELDAKAVINVISNLNQPNSINYFFYCQ